MKILSPSASFLNTVRGRLVAAFLVVVLIPLLGTTLYGNWITSKIIRQRAVEAAYADTLRRAAQVRDFLDGVEHDVYYLAGLDDLHDLLDARRFGRTKDALHYRRQLERQFYIFTATHPNYYQVRYIDADGMEVVRVDSDGRQARIIAQERLQDKSDRYYFTETIRLPSGQLYISPLDLNREHGRVEVPYKPVIRYAVPVDYLGERAGIIIINVFGDALLRFLESQGKYYSLMLVDPEGYYLFHPDAARRWGGPRDLDTGYRLQADYAPAVAAAVLSGRVGAAETDSDTLVYAPVVVAADSQPRYWVVVRAQSKRVLFAPISAFRQTAALILVVAILGAGAMVYALATRFTRPIEALQAEVRAFAETAEYHPLPVTQEDEIGQLTREFNRMARLLQAHIAQLTGLNEAGRRMTASLERQQTHAAVLNAFFSLLPLSAAALTTCSADGKCRFAAQRGEMLPDDPDWQALRAQAHSRGLAQRVSERGHTRYCAFLHLSAEDDWYLQAVGSHPDLPRPVMRNLFAALSMQAGVALENVLLYERLAEHRQRLAQLLQTLIRTQEEERKMVAYDLHDGLIQDLVGVRLCLSNFALWQQQAPELADDALRKGREQLTLAIREARRLLQGLRPTLLDDLGLLTALRELARETAELGGWQVHLDLPEGLPPLDEAVEMTAFRIVQEALANVLKHAQAQHVRLEVRADSHRLYLGIEDDGRGFEPDTQPLLRRSVGLASMRERAYLMGGHCRIHSVLHAGTRVEITLPFTIQENPA